MKYFFILILFFSNLLYAQKIDKIEIDKFTNTKKITTKPLDIEKGLFKFMSITFLTDDTTVIIHFYGSYGKVAKYIGTKSPVVFLFENKSTTEIYPPYHQATHRSEGVYDEREYFSFNYNFSYQKLKLLASQKVISFRSEFTPKEDVNFNDKVGENLKVLAQLVLNEMPIPSSNIYNNEKSKTTKVITQNTSSTATNAPAELLKKWHIKLQRQDKDGKTVEYEMTKEFLSNNEVEINTGKNIVKGKYEIANGGKYIITNLEGQSSDISEIVSLDTKTLIIKGSNGKLYIYTSE